MPRGPRVGSRSIDRTPRSPVARERRAPVHELPIVARRAPSVLAGLLVLSCLLVGCSGGQEQVATPEPSRGGTGSATATSAPEPSPSSAPTAEPGPDRTLSRTAICDSVAAADVAAASTMPVARSRPELAVGESEASGVVRCEYGYEVGSKGVGFVWIGINPNTTLDEVRERTGPDALEVTIAGAPGLYYEGEFRSGHLKVSTSAGLLEIEIRGTIGPPTPTTAEPYVAVAELTMTNLALS